MSINIYKYILYKATNLINNKFYIGITKRSLKARRKQHLQNTKNGSTTTFHRAIRKYGETNFKWEEILYCSDYDLLKNIEIQFIAEYRTQNEQYGYNMAKGGDGIAYWTGKKRDVNTIQKSQEGLKRYRELYGHPNKGRKFSKESILKRLLKIKGKIPWNKGLPMSEGQKNKLIMNSKDSKSIIAVNLENGIAETFSSINRVAKHFKVSRITITRYIHQVYPNQQLNYRFFYANEVDC